MSKVLNFDKFIREKEHETIEVTVYGDVYTVPMEIPAIIPVMMARAEEEMDTVMRTRMVMRAADSMFGVEGVNKMCQKGMSARSLGELVETVFAQINGDDGDEDEAQELDDESGKVQTSKRKKTKK